MDGPVLEDNNDGKSCHTKQNSHYYDDESFLTGIFGFLLHNFLFLLLSMILPSECVPLKHTHFFFFSISISIYSHAYLSLSAQVSIAF